MRPLPQDRPLQRILRHVLTWALVICMGVSAVFSYQQWQAIAPGSVADLLVTRSADELSRHLSLIGPRIAPDAQVIERVEEELAREDRDWTLIESLIAILADRGPVPDDLLARFDTAYGEDHGWDDTAAQCIRCMWNLASCNLDALSLTCAIPNIATPVGDIFELTRAGTTYATGGEVDTFGATLAAVGLGATALVLVSGGSTATIKAGAGTLRLAHRTGSLPPRIIETIMDAARRGVDWSSLSRVRHVDDLGSVLRADALAPAVGIASDLGRMQDSIGVSGSLRLLSKADDAADLTRLSRLTEALGPRTQGMLEVVGKSRLARMMLRLSDEALALIAGIAGLGAALMSLIGQAGLNFTLRRARKRLS